MGVRPTTLPAQAGLGVAPGTPPPAVVGNGVTDGPGNGRRPNTIMSP